MLLLNYEKENHSQDQEIEKVLQNRKLLALKLLDNTKQQFTEILNFVKIHKLEFALQEYIKICSKDRSIFMKNEEDSKNLVETILNYYDYRYLILYFR